MSQENSNRFGTQTLNTKCKKWQLSKNNDAAIIDDYNNESLAIGGADINVFKLLGVHEQGQLVDLAGNGIAISGGTATGYSASDAFYDGENPCTQHRFWRSSQKGQQDILTSAYIGYNFGVPKLENGRDRYGEEVDLKQHITTIRLEQSDDPNRRTTKIRIERSDDGLIWYGVAILDVQNTNEKIQYSFKESALTRYWRIRPITFTGSDTDFWEVKSIELIDWEESNLFQVQDEYGWIENRDRDYADTSIQIKAFYDLFEKESELTQVGFAITGGLYYITANFNDIVNRLGRPLVIGDILELPSEAQYDPNMNEIKKYLEVTDVSWSAEGYTPGWKPIMLRIIAEPMLAKQETLDIVGDMVGAIDQSGLFQLDDSKYSHLYKQSEKMREKAESDVPQRGSDTAEIKVLSQEEKQVYEDQGFNVDHLSLNDTQLYVEDAIPPNGLPYSEGTTYPSNPVDKSFHRLTYEGLSENIPARLYQYSAAKGRWIYLETDLRQKHTPQKPSIHKIKESENSISARFIGKDKNNDN